MKKQIQPLFSPPSLSQKGSGGVLLTIALLHHIQAPYGAHIQKNIMKEKMFFADVPEEVSEEVSALYNMGINIDDIEYIISSKGKDFS